MASMMGRPRIERGPNSKRAAWLLISAFLFTLVLACAPEPRQVAVAVPRAADDTGIQTPRELAPPAPTASQGPEAAAASAGTPTAVALREPSPFVEGVRIGGNALLDIAGKRAFLTTELLLLAVHDDEVRIEPALLEGLQRGNTRYPRVFGDMPASGWVVQTRYAELAERNALSRWSGSEWVNVDRSLQAKDQDVNAASSWSNGRLLMLVGSESDTQPSFVQVGGSRAALPQLPSALRDDFSCLHALQPGALSALPSGEVFLAGNRCSATADDGSSTRGVIISRWARGEARGRVTLLPGLFGKDVAAGEIRSILAVSGTDVLVAGTRQAYREYSEEPASAYLAHFDGKSWRIVSAPPAQRIDELQRAPNGRLWALGDGQLWSAVGPVSESLGWQPVALPRLGNEAGLRSVSSFWVQDNEQVWATLGDADSTYLVRTKRGRAPLSAPGDDQLAQLSNALDPTASCANSTLVLRDITRSVSKDADMPRARAALRGYTELEGHVQLMELSFLTHRYLAARGDIEALHAIREILSDAHIPGLTPEFRCLNGAPTRTLSVDFSARPGQAKKTSRMSRESGEGLRDLRNP